MERKNPDEHFFLDQLIKGNKLAFQYFFDKYYVALCNFANVYLNNTYGSEEIVQEVFIYLWEKKGKLKRELNINAYLIKAVKNRSLNFLRNEKNKARIINSLDSSEISSCDSADIHADNILIRNRINISIDSLPVKCKEVYLLVKEEELSYKEVAEKLNISVKTVESQMGKALKILRTKLSSIYKDFFWV